MNLEQQNQLSSHGWTTFTFDGDLLQLASEYGAPVSARIGGPLLDLLKVKTPEKSHSNSLSARFGTGAFPFHTDGAHHERVPHFIFLRLVAPEQSMRKTLLLDFRGALNAKTQHILSSEIWRVTGGKRPFLSPIVGESFLRFDPCIMRPAISGRKIGIEVVNRIIETFPNVAFEWRQMQVLVIDNHRMLHGREAEPNETDENEIRTLERVLIL